MAKKDILSELGRSGLNRWGGIVSEEMLTELQGKKGVAAYKEMSENDDMIGASLYAKDISYKTLREACLSGELKISELKQWQEEYGEYIQTVLNPIWLKALEDSVSMVQEISEKAAVYQPSKFFYENYLRNQCGHLITVISADQHIAVQSLLGHLMSDKNMHAEEASRFIRPLIGLNRPQMRANYNYYNTILQLATEEGKTLDAAKKIATEKAAAKAVVQHRYRATMIARTELAFAYNEAHLQTTLEAVDCGLFEEEELVKIVCTSQTERMCPKCGDMEGEMAGLKEVFSNGRRAPPFHPNCACTLMYDEKWLVDQFGVMGGGKKPKTTTTATKPSATGTSGTSAATSSKPQTANVGATTTQPQMVSVGATSQTSSATTSNTTTPSPSTTTPSATATPPKTTTPSTRTPQVVAPKTPTTPSQSTGTNTTSSQSAPPTTTPTSKPPLTPSGNSGTMDSSKVAELNQYKDSLGVKGALNLNPIPIDVSQFNFDNTHIQDERGRNITREEAINFMDTALFSLTKWNGKYFNYYSLEGAVFINVDDPNIRTAFKKEQYSENIDSLIDKIMEFLTDEDEEDKDGKK